MRRITNTGYYSKSIGRLSRGCRFCVKGRKLVLFVTGLCSRQCYYCPLSDSKKNKDVIFANERPIVKDYEIVEEAKISSATSASITGGDPILVIGRTVRYIRLLKRHFGKEFHIHLYAPLELVDEKKLRLLHKAGLDEIRFHPDIYCDKYWHKISAAQKFNWDVGVEIPAIPGEEKRIFRLIDYLDGKIKFLNLNELEISDTNAGAMLLRRFHPKDEISYAIAGSEQTALRIMRHCIRKKFSVHYCTAKLKDAVQLANRIKLRAKKSSEKFDIINNEGILIRGAIYLPELKPNFAYTAELARISKTEMQKILRRLNRIRSALIKEYKIPASFIKVDKLKLRIITALPIVEQLSETIKEMGAVPAEVHQYPTFDQLEVELKFL
ncbi:MAG: radical SAM protein [Candidatus Woesearchaeota archaeon]